MNNLQKLQSTILKTKKRLSNRTSVAVPLAICFVFLSSVTSFSFRALTTGTGHSYVQGEIPIVRIAAPPEAVSNRPEAPAPRLDARTPVVILTTEAFFFGDSEAFSDDLTNVRNKFEIKHIEGQPQIVTLLKTMSSWDKSRDVKSFSGSLILSPATEIPMPIVIKVMAAIQELSPYKKVILAGGVI